MTNRWKVEQEFTWFNGTYWIAWQPKKGWKAAAPDFPTHTEALAYADRMARTITVTLPRDPLVWESGRDSDGRLYVEETNGNEICYEPGQLGAIARHLLAYHYQKEAQ